MDDKQFWKIIKQAGREADGDPDAIADGVAEQLAELPPEEIKSFDAILREKLDSAANWKLWGAAYLMNGGCSNDGFLYFRCWLVAQGQKVYEAAIADPDSLAKVADPDCDCHECEELLYMAMGAYEAVTGNELVARAVDACEPTGQHWDFEDMDANAKQLPRLAAMYAG